MKRLLAIGIWIVAFCGTGVYQDQIDQIDAQIKELKEMKRGYEARAIRAENQADRLQFEEHFVLETRRYYRIADGVGPKKKSCENSGRDRPIGGREG